MDYISDDDQDTADLEAAIYEYDSQSNSCRSSIVERRSECSSSVDSVSKLSRIESALTMNNITDEKYVQLEKILESRLEQCRQNLQKQNNCLRPDANSSQKQKELFKYFNCLKPYFKDKYNTIPEDNSDTILMKKSEMHDYIYTRELASWTLKDKYNFLNIILSMSQSMVNKKISAEISDIKRSLKKKFDVKLSTKLKKLEQDRLSVLPLSACALPKDKEYDWEEIASKLDNRHTPNEFQAMWRLFLHPSVNKDKWTKTEHSTLENLAREHNYEDWDSIARKLNTNRSSYQCFVYFKINIGQTRLLGRKWSKEEDEYLKRIVETCRVGNYIPWSKVATYMQHRTKLQIYNRWLRSSQPNIKKGRFIKEEDAVILAAVGKYGTNFHKVASFLPGRTINAVKIRYYDRLTQSSSMSWTVEEDKMLLELVENDIFKNNINYSDLAKHFTHKNRTHVRQRYLILKNWLTSHPEHPDLKLAPRRSTRPLQRVKEKLDLKTAIEKLELRLQDELENASANKTSEYHNKVDNLLTDFFKKEIGDNRMLHTVQEKIRTKLNINKEMSETQVINVKNCLLLLRANLDMMRFNKSILSEKYSGLLSEAESVPMVQVKTYSRKRPLVDDNEAKTKSHASIWMNLKCLDCRYLVLPPNLATVISCSCFLLQSPLEKAENKNTTFAARSFTKALTYVQQLTERLEVLFFWPLLLSNYEPSHLLGGDLFAEHEKAANPNPQVDDIPEILQNVFEPNRIRSASIMYHIVSPPIDLPALSDEDLKNSSALMVKEGRNGSIVCIDDPEKDLKLPKKRYLAEIGHSLRNLANAHVTSNNY